MPQNIDLIGKKFGKLEVISRGSRKKDEWTWLCKCDCGVTKEVRWSGLRKGHSKSCGCLNKAKKLQHRSNDSIINQKYDKLLVLSRLEDSVTEFCREYKYKCQCDCGVICEFTAKEIRKRYHCCRKCDKISKNHNYKGISSYYWLNLKRGAKDRSLEFSITPEYCWTLYLQQKAKCKLSGIKLVIYPKSSRLYLQTASLDRIDSTKGYIEGNVQWVHKDVNRIKNEYNEIYFLKIIKDIYNYRIKNEQYPSNNSNEN